MLWGPPNHKMISLLFHNFNLATVMNYNASICYADGLGGPCGRVIQLPKGYNPQVENL